MAVYHIPAMSEAAANAVINGIEVGRIPALPEYLDAALARAEFDKRPRGEHKAMRLWVIERGEPETGADIINAIGAAAAAIMIVCGGPYAVGFASIL